MGLGKKEGGKGMGLGKRRGKKMGLGKKEGKRKDCRIAKRRAKMLARAVLDRLDVHI